ncbi:MAG: zinc ribbon domain-containing protein [Anaerolineales bacterium]
MPAYDFRCKNCQTQTTIHQTYEQYGVEDVVCPNCDSRDMERIIGRVRFSRSEESRMESLDDMSSWGDVDESDPKSMARMMRKMSSELGEEIPPEFNEVVDRLESGESPDDIEKSMPDLGTEGGFDSLG